MLRKNALLSLLLVCATLIGVLSVSAQDTPSFTYWGGLIFSDAANNAQVERIEQWGEENGVNVEVVMINQNEMTQRVSAAIEAGTMPDALDLGFGEMLLLSQNGELEPVADVYEAIGEAHGGWLPGVQALMDNPAFEGEIYGVPYAANGNILFRRNDVLEPLGYADAPETWEELGEMAVAANNPPEYYGAGFALSNVGDGNLTETMLRSWGGRIADDEGKTCTIDSEATRSFLTWITDLYAEGVFPPGATTWDGAGDNTAYQSGQAVFIANPGSVYLYMRDNDPDLGEGTRYSALPAGPEMRLSPFNVVVRAISADSENKDLAKDLLAYLADDTFVEEYYNNAIYGPALEGHTGFAVFTDSPVHAGLLDLAQNGTPGSFPDVNNPALAEFSSNFLIPKMVQRVVVDGISIEDAVLETQAACEAIYAKYEE
jgi:multiple sugar transport system substrate-binding protein